MGPLGVCVERTTTLHQPPSVDFPTIRASQPPLPFPLLPTRKILVFLLRQLFPTHPFAPVPPCEPFSRRGYLRNIYLDNLTRLIYRA